MKRIWTCLLLPLLLAGLAAGDKPMQIEDALAIKNLGGIEWGPQGQWIYYTVREWNKEDNRYATQAYRISPEGGDPVQLTRDEKGIGSPQVSPDGRFLAFLASRQSGNDEDDSKGRQIWLLPLTAGEAYKLTSAENGAGDFAWAPDSKSIAYTSQESFFEKEERERRKKEKDDAVVVDSDFAWTHLWSIALDAEEATQLTEGEFNAGSPDFSPDGKQIVFSAGYQPAQPSSWKHIDDHLESDLMLISAEGGEPKNLTPGPGQASSPRFSPDGKHISFSASEDAGFAVKTNLMALDIESGESWNVMPEHDDSINGGAQWTPDGQNLLFTLGERVYTHVYSVPFKGGSTERLTPELGISRSWDASPDGRRFAWAPNDPMRPSDLHVSAPAGPSEKLTDLNPQVAELAIAESRPVVWEADDGMEIEGVLVLPVNYEEGKRYPLIVQIHGGPTGRHTHGFNNRRSQIWAGRGFAVLQPNPRGSTGYGFEFTQLNQSDWGGKDFHADDMSGVDKVIDMGIADPDKMAVMGGSYGGFSTFWAVTQTDRFKAAIGHAAISDWYSFYGQTDIPQYLKWGFEGHAWEREEVYEKYSPFEYASNVKTPLMITHGEEDRRVPIAQAEQYYTALKKMGKTVVFVRYPREGHGIREPNHVIDLQNRQNEWIDEHLGIERPEEKQEAEKVETPGK